MKKELFYILCLLLLIAASYSCRQSYEPAVIKANRKFLVVDGVINIGSNAVTTINLSRTRNITDSITTSPEPGDEVSIKSKSGSTYLLHDLGDGTYISGVLSLPVNDEYALQVVAAGNTYTSDYVIAKQTPPVDSLEWIYTPGTGVTIYANTHDPQNKTRYYRWEYVETSQYHSVYEAEVGVRNGLMFYIVDEPQNQRYNCWQTHNSNNVLLASSINLSEDIISHDSITIIPQDDTKIEVRYSILLKQYALDTTAYQYWQVLQKNTQQLGSLFDAQPTQLTGNIHNTANAAEPVLGYISASSIEEKRIFINNADVPNWNAIVYSGQQCDDKIIDQNKDNYLIYNYFDTAYAPYYFSGVSSLDVARKTCLDCTLMGGTNQKPSFW